MSCEHCGAPEPHQDPHDGFLAKLTIFKPGGKYYTSGCHISHQQAIHEIWNEVDVLMKHGKLPGLSESPSGHEHWIVSIDVPRHRHNHPTLIVPRKAAMERLENVY